MKKIYGVGLGIAAFTCVVTASIASKRVMAQGVSTPEMQVPAIREPHHFVKLDNKYARVLDVTVAPFSGTLYHIHENPYFWISIGPATLRGQTLGAKEIINIEPVDAEVRYSPVLTHRVGNIGSTLFRNITVQIQARDDVSPARSVSRVAEADRLSGEAGARQRARARRAADSGARPVDGTLYRAAFGPADCGARRDDFRRAARDERAHASR